MNLLFYIIITVNITTVILFSKIYYLRQILVSRSILDIQVICRFRNAAMALSLTQNQYYADKDMFVIFQYISNKICLWYSNIYPTRYVCDIPIYIQQDATLHSLFISGNYSTCVDYIFFSKVIKTHYSFEIINKTLMFL